MFLQDTGLDLVIVLVLIFILLVLNLLLYTSTSYGADDSEHNKTYYYDGYYLSGGYETLETDSSSRAIDYFKREASRRGTICTGIYRDGELIADMKELN